jgi:hypothetical protein
MASGIDPNLKPTKPATNQPAQTTPAKPVAAAPGAKPAAAAAAAAKPAAAAPAAATPAAEPAPSGRGPSVAATLLRTTPAWAISMLVHIIALLAMALMVTPPQEKEKPRLITSSPSEADDNLEDAIEDVPEVKPTDLPTVSDVTVPTEVTVVEDVKVVSEASDVDAAPIAVELTDFGAQTAPASDMLAQIGAVGGTGGGFGGRTNTKQMASQNGGGADTEQAVEAALAWFIEHQMPDGGWSFDFKACPSCKGQCRNSGETAFLKDRLAPTTLALLPLLGKGYTHTAGPYKGQIERGLAFLVGLVNQTKGQLYKAGTAGGMYSQGLAGIVLAESYAMTQDQRLAVPAQVVLNSIMECQNPVNGGWQYQPKKGGDTSVLGWQLMALKSGHMAHLQVNPLTVKKASEFLDSVQGDEYGATYGYTSPGNGGGTTPAGLLCRMYLGWKKDHPGIEKGTAAVAAKWKPNGSLYMNYYATQVLHHMEGDMWLSWNEKMKALLLPTQCKSGHEKGSWQEGVDKDHGSRVAGRLYTTSLATMMLEAYYRHMPIYRNQSVGEEFKEE